MNKLTINKKLIVGILAILALVLVLAGCSTESSNTTPTETVYVTPTPDLPEPDISTPEDDYLWAVRHNVDNYYIDEASDRDLIDLGWSVCDVLDQGYSVEDIIYELIGSGTVGTNEEAEFAGAIVGGAVYNLCPEHSWQVDSY